MARGFVLMPPAPRVRRTIATYRQLLKAVHIVLAARPALAADVGELEEAAKWQIARWGLQGARDARGSQLGRAIAAALFQRTKGLGR